MHDKGIIGVLKGFFGYNSNPNVIELVLLIAALMFGMNMEKILSVVISLIDPYF